MEFTLDCGCRLFIDSSNMPDIIYCPLHRSAPDLYEACKEMNKRFIPQTPDDSGALLNLYKAIAKAEGG